MEMILKQLRGTIILLLLTGALQVRAQHTDTLFHVAYFGPGAHRLDAQAARDLDTLLPILRQISHFEATYRGFTDSRGDSTDNYYLSCQRISSVHQHLMSSGIPTFPHLNLCGGETAPLGDNRTPSGRRLNRRVELKIYLPQKAESDSAASPPVKAKPPLYPGLGFPELASEPEAFCIDPHRDTTLRTEKGILIYIPAGAFPLPYPDSCLEFRVLADPDLATQLHYRVLYPDPSEQLRGSGMIYTEAGPPGQAIELNPGHHLQYLLPTSAYRSDLQLFSGNGFVQDTFVHWSPTPHLEYSRLLPCEFNNLNCMSYDCKFFFCKIWLFMTGGRRPFKASTRDSRARRKWLSRFGQDPKVLRHPEPPISFDCREVEELLEKYGVKDIASLREALKQEVFREYGVSSTEKFLIAKEKERLESLEQDFGSERYRYSSLQYYTFRSAKMGWNGLFSYEHLTPDQLTQLRVKCPLRPLQELYLYFPASGKLFPASNWRQGHYIFRKIPKGREVYVLGFRYEGREAFIGIQKTRTDAGSTGIELKSASLDRIRQVLKEIGK